MQFVTALELDAEPLRGLCHQLPVIEEDRRCDEPARRQNQTLDRIQRVAVAVLPGLSSGTRVERAAAIVR